MALWSIQRLELVTTGPILGVYPCTAILKDLEPPGNTKVEQFSVNAADLATDPTLILVTLSDKGYYPNDWGTGP